MAKDYSQQDFTSTFEELLAIVEASTTKWSPRNSTEADPGVVLLKLMALLEDKANYRADMSRAQDYLDTVSDKQSAYELLQMLGYIMKNARGATGTVYLSRIPSAWADKSDTDAVVLNRFDTKFTDATGTLSFFVTRDVVVNKGSSTDKIAVPVQVGKPFQITKEGKETFTVKDIDEDGRLYLGRTDLAQNGVFVRTATPKIGDTGYDYSDDWTYLDFVVLQPTGKWYTVGVGENGEMYVQFQSDFSNRIGLKEFVILGVCESGSQTNIAASMLSTFADSADLKKLFAVSQPDAFYTGQDQESIAQATSNYYATKDICGTFVTAADFVSAIKYALRGLSNDPNKGARYFSNVLVRTAQDRAIPVRTICNGQEYTLYVPDGSNKPANQIDVIGLKASDKYMDSFKRFGENDATEVELFQADITEQLRNNRARDVKIKIDSTSKRFLAVTTPKMTIRMANYTIDKASALKSKIRAYFYSNYSADKVTPGKPLDHQKIVDDITALSPDIISVSMNELQYKVYERLVDVDGDESAEISDSTKLDAIARSVLAGQVPLFRYANRQNTVSKRTSTYDTLVTGADYEETIVRPFGTKQFAQLGRGRVSPLLFISPRQLAPSAFTDADTKTGQQVTLQGNAMLQFRKPLLRSVQDYGYGVQYTCQLGNISGSLGPPVASKISITSTSTFNDGSVLAVGSEIRLLEDLIINNPESYFDVPSTGWPHIKDGKSYLSQDETYVITKGCMTVLSAQQLKLAAGSIVAVGSQIAIRSKVNKKEYYPVAVSDGSQYQLKQDDRLKLFNSSGEVLKEFKPGEWVGPIGFDLLNKQDPTLLPTSASVSVLAPDESVISTDFKYFLTLQKDGNLLITPAKPYMLEENEVLIYADQGITEYVTLGPGTILSVDSTLTEGVILTNHSFADIEGDIASGFKDVPVTLHAQATEISTYGKGKIVKFYKDSKVNTSASTFNLDGQWRSVITLAEDVEYRGAYPVIKAEVYGPTDADKTTSALLATFGEGYFYRLIWKVATDAEGIAALESPFLGVLTTAEVPSSKKYENDELTFTDGEGGSLVINRATHRAAYKPLSSAKREGIYLYSGTSLSLLLDGPDSSSSSRLYFSFKQAANEDSWTFKKVETPFPGPIMVLTELAVGEEAYISSTIPFTAVIPAVEREGQLLLPVGSFALVSYAVRRVRASQGGGLRVTTSASGMELVAEQDNAELAQVRLDCSTAPNGQLVQKVFFQFRVENGDARLWLVGRKAGGNLENLSGLYSFHPDAVEDKGVLTIQGGTFPGRGVVIGFDLSERLRDYAERELSLKVSLSKREATAYLTDLSFITDYSAESGHSLSKELDSSGVPLWTLFHKVCSLDTENRFNFLCTPLEELVNPADGATFLTAAHPFNLSTVPFVLLDFAEIKIIGQR